MRDFYFEYLCDMAKAYSPSNKGYSRLLMALYERRFTWLHPMDENRVADGFDLRKEYLRSSPRSVNAIRDYSNVLEVLLAFSRRIEIDIMGEPGNDRPERWFWAMLGNLGLLEFDDSNFDSQKVDRILDIWLNRKFARNGKGNIFLTSKTDTDLREVEMWWQMQRYMAEKYGS